MDCISFDDVSFSYPMVEGDLDENGKQIIPQPVFDTGELEGEIRVADHDIKKTELHELAGTVGTVFRIREVSSSRWTLTERLFSDRKT